MEQLVLLLIIAGISLINWLMEKSKKLREEKRLEKRRADSAKQPPSLPQEAPAPTMPEEDQGSEQIRRLLEAMGMPTGFPEAEPATEFAPAPPEPAQASIEEAPLPIAPAIPRKPLRLKRTLAKTTTKETNPWSKRLRSRSDLREAIVIREILGPPKAISTP